MNNGWGMFTRMLEYKLDWQGKILVKIDKWYPSSQLCSQCGVKHDRDHNAVINIKNEGARIICT